MNQTIRACVICGVSIDGAHFNATMCSAKCRRVNKTRQGHAQRALAYEKLPCGWCGASIQHLSQQARFCSSSCLDKDRYRRNRVERIAAAAAWAKTPAGRHSSNEHRRRRRARLQDAGIVPFTREQLAQRLACFSGCWMCGEPASTLDHVKPLSKGGPHMLANLRPACRPCNSAKSAHWEGVTDALERAGLWRGISLAWLGSR